MISGRHCFGRNCKAFTKHERIKVLYLVQLVRQPHGSVGVARFALLPRLGDETVYAVHAIGLGREIGGYPALDNRHL